jgi:hypothetical protein
MCPALVSVCNWTVWNLGEGGKVREAVGEMGTKGFMKKKKERQAVRSIKKNRNNGHYKNCKASSGNVMPTFATHNFTHGNTAPI